MLSDKKNQIGTFMVRLSEREKDSFRLSIRCCTEKNGLHMRHYRIEQNRRNKYYIYSNHTFDTIFDLMEFYTSKYLTNKIAQEYLKSQNFFSTSRQTAKCFNQSMFTTKTYNMGIIS